MRDLDPSGRIARAWDEACWSLGIRARASTLEDLLARWSEPHRRYHDVAHLEACCIGLDAHRALAERPGEVLAALLFHDAVYDPTRTDNETASAMLARAALAEASPDAVARVAASIEATQTHEARTEDEALVLDVDLSILGADPETYDAFEHAIRAEYAHVPDAAFRAGRLALLQGLLERTNVYALREFRDELERDARANLVGTISALQR